MTREQIEKAARDYALDQLGIVGLPGRSEAMKAFIAGAQWRINSVWHDASEEPNGMFVILIDFGTEISPEEFGLGFTAEDLNGAKRWAYVLDLIPERKEETK